MFCKLKLKFFFIFTSVLVHLCIKFAYGFRLWVSFGLWLPLCIRFGSEVSVVGFKLALAFGCDFQFSYGLQLWVLIWLWAFGFLHNLCALCLVLTSWCLTLCDYNVYANSMLDSVLDSIHCILFGFFVHDSGLFVTIWFWLRVFM